MARLGLPPLNEYGFLPVPPPFITVRMEDMPGCFGAKPKRKKLWSNCAKFLEWLRSETSVSEVFMDGRFLSSSDEVDLIEVGIELTVQIIRADGLDVFKVPAREEWDVRLRFFAPRRPAQHNFHEEFTLPDPEVRLRDAPPDLRKGYICIKL